MRGFRDAGVSPRDSSTHDVLGGMYEWTGTVEWDFPSGLPKELGVQSKLFTDFGSIGGTDPSISKSSISQSFAPRVSVGTGFVWRSPMGPINVDVAVPVLKYHLDKTEFFRLNFGTRF